MRTIIFANGVLSDPGSARALVQPTDRIVAADGGARHCRALGLTPHALVGDFDSLDGPEIEALRAAGAEVVRYPRRKDFTDLELALRYAEDHGADDILVLGALGARWDQTLANLLLPASADFSARISLVDGPQEILLVQAGETLEIRGNPGDTVSLIPLSGSADGIVTEGLDYPLHHESLEFGSTRGISNVLVAPPGRVALASGLLLCVVIHAGS